MVIVFFYKKKMSIYRDEILLRVRVSRIMSRPVTGGKNLGMLRQGSPKENSCDSCGGVSIETVVTESDVKKTVKKLELEETNSWSAAQKMMHPGSELLSLRKTMKRQHDEEFDRVDQMMKTNFDRAAKTVKKNWDKEFQCKWIKTVDKVKAPEVVNAGGVSKGGVEVSKEDDEIFVWGDYYEE